MRLIKQITYMQIFITKLRITLCIAIFTYAELCSASANFSDYFQTEPVIKSAIADRVTYYYSEDIELTDAQQKIELLYLNSQLNSIETLYAEQAIYWFIRGLNDRNIAAYYTHLKEQIPANKYIKNKNNAYEKALQLAKINPKELSAAIYSTMKHGLPLDLKIQATQFELAQGGNVDNESAYWYLHWSNIDQLKKAGRQQEAEDAYKQMQTAMQANKVDMSVYADLNQQVENQTFNASAEKTTHSPKEEVEKNKLNSKEVVMPSLLILALISLLLVTVYEFFIKKRRSKHKPNY